VRLIGMDTGFRVYDEKKLFTHSKLWGYRFDGQTGMSVLSAEIKIVDSDLEFDCNHISDMSQNNTFLRQYFI